MTLARPAGARRSPLAQADGNHFVSSGKWVGARTPVHCTADGKVLLAFDAAAPAAAHSHGARIARSSDRDALERELRDVRARGYAIAESEFERGLVGVAVPVLGGRRLHRRPLRVRSGVPARPRGPGRAGRRAAATHARELERALGARG